MNNFILNFSFYKYFIIIDYLYFNINYLFHIKQLIVYIVNKI